MELNPVEGTIYARSTVHIKVTVRPCHSEAYSSVIKYVLTSLAKGKHACLQAMHDLRNKAACL